MTQEEIEAREKAADTYSCGIAEIATMQIRSAFRAGWMLAKIHNYEEKLQALAPQAEASSDAK